MKPYIPHLTRPSTHIYPFYNNPAGKTQGKANSKYDDVWPRKVIIAEVTMAKNALALIRLELLGNSDDDAEVSEDDEDNDCVDAFTACNPFNPRPLPPNQPGTVGTPVATSSHLHQSHEDMLEMRMQALLIILIAMLVVVDDGGLGTLPQL